MDRKKNRYRTMKDKSNNNIHEDDNNQNKGSPFNRWNQYMSAKRQKLIDQFKEEVVKFSKEMKDSSRDVNNDGSDEEGGEELSTLFAGVCIWVNGYTKPPALTLKQLMARYGGMYLNAFDGTRVTHTIATNLPFAKIKDLKGNEKIVTPDWIVDSIKQKMLLPIRDYLLIKASGDIERFFVSKTDRCHGELGSDSCQIGDGQNQQIEESGSYQLEGQLVENINELFDENDSNTICANEDESRSNESFAELMANMVKDNDSKDSTDSNNKTDEAISRKTTTIECVLEADQSANTNSFNQSNYIPNSMSQVDPEFLKALPLNLRHEIMSTINCNNMANTKLIKTSDTSSAKMANKKRSSSFKNKKASKLSPVKSSNGKHVKSGPLDKMFKDLKSNKRGGLLTSDTGANICRKTKTEDVISLIREWIETEEDLIDEDVAYVTKYFCDLIDERKYEQVKQIGIAFYNSVNFRNQLVWKETFNDVRNIIITELNAVNPSAKINIHSDLPFFQL